MKTLKEMIKEAIDDYHVGSKEKREKYRGQLFSFDAESHTYWFDGRIIPSVTQILTDVGIIGSYMSNPEPYVERGSAVHLACQLDDEGDLDESSIAPEIAGFLHAKRKLYSELVFQITEIEKPFFDEKELFGGTPDRVGLIGQEPFVLDLKSGSIPHWTGIQLAAYAVLIGGGPCMRRIAAELRADGTYSLKEYAMNEFRRDVGVFRAAHTVYRWKQCIK